MSILYCMFSRLESGDIRTWRWSWSAGLRRCLLDVDGAWAAGRLAACFCSFVECLEAWSWTWVACWSAGCGCWMVPGPGRLGAWLPAFVVLWNACTCRLGAGLGSWVACWSAGSWMWNCGWCGASVPQCLGGWAPGWLAACFCSFMECLEAWSWTWDLAVVCR